MQGRPTQRRVLIGPKGPFILAWVMGLLATLSIATGILDVALPIFTDAPPFAFAFALAQQGGPVALFVYVLVHNLGLACLVGGWGFFAAAAEGDPEKRWMVAPILAGAVFLALATGVEYIFQAGWHTRNELLVLSAVELIAIVALSIRAYRELERYVPTRAMGWSLVQPMNRIAPAFVAWGVVLAVAAAWEALALAGAF